MERQVARARDARIAVRVNARDQREIEEAARSRGYTSPSAFVRTAIRNKLHGREELTGIEERSNDPPAKPGAFCSEPLKAAMRGR
jgi:Arc/MetJ-type ribon-helix-helix transcriptional regulator